MPQPAASSPSPARRPSRTRHRVVVVGGGNAGISVAARLRRAGVGDVAIIDPARTHWYQPLWTLVGGGCAPIRRSARPQASVIPAGVHWYQQPATHIDAESRSVELGDGRKVSGDAIVVAPGIQLDWDAVPGLTDALRRNGVSSNYTAELAPKTWELIRTLRSGTAVFGMPAGPIKCGGAPQKIAYLAADYWRRRGVLNDIRVVLVLPTPAMFGVAVFARELERVAARYGIEVRLSSEITEVDGARQEVIVRDLAADTKERIGFDLLHHVPPQSAPDWLKATALRDPASPGGYVEVDKHTLRHVGFPEIFALGDAGNTPNSKTGAAIRKQAPVVVENLLAVLSHRQPTASYDGYAACPITTSRRSMLLAEFDYEATPRPSFPFIDTTRERRDMWLLKKYGLPALYWNGFLTGRL
jgi:sulfide:quinone oxidoreductase